MSNAARRERAMVAAATKPRSDPDVELRAVLTEVRKVLDCHHRNTHKPLRERVARCLERLKP